MNLVLISRERNLDLSTYSACKTTNFSKHKDKFHLAWSPKQFESTFFLFSRTFLSKWGDLKLRTFSACKSTFILKSKIETNFTAISRALHLEKPIQEHFFLDSKNLSSQIREKWEHLILSILWSHFFHYLYYHIVMPSKFSHFKLAPAGRGSFIFSQLQSGTNYTLELTMINKSNTCWVWTTATWRYIGIRVDSPMVPLRDTACAWVP